jgi:hypothetical protein
MRKHTIMALSGVVSILIGLGCSRPTPEERPLLKGELEQPVKRLREDTESELQDLRGRWLATEGLLIRLRDQIQQLQAKMTEMSEKHSQQFGALEITIETITAEFFELKNGASLPDAEKRNRERITRCFEEIYCLRTRDEDAGASSILRRYGFRSEEDWDSTWNNLELSDAFRQKTEARAKMLCP